MMAGDPKSFSFSGLKTAALRKSEELRRSGVWEDPILRKDFAASVERAIVDSLLEKSLAAVKELRPKRFVISGGVAANRLLRSEFEQKLAAQGVELLIPRPEFCTDNAAMIGVVGAMSLEHFGAEYFPNFLRGTLARVSLRSSRRKPVKHRQSPWVGGS